MWFTFNKSMLPSIYHPYCCSCFRTDCFTNNSNNVLGTEFKLNALVWNHWIFCCSHLQVTAVHLTKLNNSSYSSSIFDITACVKVLRGVHQPRTYKASKHFCYHNQQRAEPICQQYFALPGIQLEFLTGKKSVSQQLHTLELRLLQGGQLCCSVMVKL